MAAVPASENRPKLRVIAGRGGEAASELSDEVLIEAVVRGDASVAGALYDRLLPLVDATLFRMLGSRAVDHEASERSFARDDPERDLTLRREIARVRLALREMNSQRAEALVLHDVLGHDLAEVSALLGCIDRCCPVSSRARTQGAQAAARRR
jgi:DNA-directed RNA polymerase specialized sigma24 family protein